MAAKFWANSNAEAKRKYRFILDISKQVPGQALKFEKWVVTKVNRPSFQISETTHSYLNHTFYFPGRLTWQDVAFTVVDAINPDSTGVLMGMLSASGYKLPNQASAPESQGTISKAKSNINTVKISSIDADGLLVDTWTLWNAWISQANMGDFDYTADDLMSIDVTMKYDYATYQIEGQEKGERINSAGGNAFYGKLANPGNS